MCRIIKNEVFFSQDLVGQLLVSTPTIEAETIFAKSVIFIVSHDHTGTVGVIVNRVINSVNSNIVFKALNIKNKEEIPNFEVHFGGPVDSEKGLILHSADYKCDNLVKINNNLSLSSNYKIFEDIAAGKGPKSSLLILGYSAWSVGQLEEEIKNNSWLITPYKKDIIFSEENSNKWEKAIKSLGINPISIAGEIGHG